MRPPGRKETTSSHEFCDAIGFLAQLFAKPELSGLFQRDRVGEIVARRTRARNGKLAHVEDEMVTSAAKSNSTAMGHFRVLYPDNLCKISCVRQDGKRRKRDGAQN